jgi:hypothetical protein
MVALPVEAHNARQAAQAQEEAGPEALIYSVVKITNDSANLFSAERSLSHGTGFFVGLDPRTGRGLIFTNKHVISNDGIDAQRLMVEFSTPQTRGETIQAKLIYTSLLHDFAVLEFDPKLLSRAVLDHPLGLPGPKSPFYDFVKNERLLRGRPCVAIGNPFDDSNVTTYGQVTGLRFDPLKGPFIQTQTPINPGNSGGPLISMDTGEVIGINTMKLMGADNTGYVTPIGPVMREFAEWREQREKKIHPNLADQRRVDVSLSVVNESTLKLLGLHEAVGKAVPGYWENFTTALMVGDAPEGEVLQKDDVLLRFDGEIIGGYPYNFFQRLQRSKVKARLQVLRHGQVVDVEAVFPSSAVHDLRMKVDYVYLAGLLFQEMPLGSSRRVFPGLTSNVIVRGIIDSAEINFGGTEFPPEGSVLVAVSFNGEDIPIHNLFDLKKAINANREKPFIKLRVHRANQLRLGDEARLLISPATGMPLVDGTESMYILPMRDALTPYQFSLNKFRKQFGFTEADAATRDWREFRRPEHVPTSCQKLLSAKAGAAASKR